MINSIPIILTFVLNKLYSKGYKRVGIVKLYAEQLKKYVFEKKKLPETIFDENQINSTQVFTSIEKGKYKEENLSHIKKIIITEIINILLEPYLGIIVKIETEQLFQRCTEAEFDRFWEDLKKRDSIERNSSRFTMS